MIDAILEQKNPGRRHNHGVPPKDSSGPPANDDLDRDSPWLRAELILQAHARISNSEVHPYDAPGPAVRALLTDLMHFCDAHSVGKQKGSSDYVDFDAELKAASKDFQVQVKMMNSAMTAPSLRARPIQEQSYEPATPENDPKLTKIITALEERQAHEVSELAARQSREPDADPLRHEHERDAQARKFEDERERYIREYNKGLDLAEHLEAEERQKGFEHDLSE